MIRRRKVLSIPEFYAGRRPDFLFFFLIFLKVFFECVIASSGTCYFGR